MSLTNTVCSLACTIALTQGSTQDAGEPTRSRARDASIER